MDKEQFLILLLGIVMVKSDEIKPIWNATFLDVLEKDLETGYDTQQRELEMNSEINMDLRVRHVEVDELTSTIQIYGRIKWNWVDDKLQWDASKYGNITQMRFSHWRVWTPQLDLLNEIDTGKHGFSDAQVVVQSNGSCSYDTDMQLAAYCGMDHANWPFDYHACQFEFETRVYNAALFKTKYIHGSEMDPDFISSEWEVKGIIFGPDRKKERLNALTLNIVVARRTGGYMLTLFAPVTVFVLFTLCGFWLPVQAGEKILLNGFVGAMVNMYMLYFAGKLPTMGVNTPLVVKFCCITMFLTICSMIISILVLAISRTQHVYGTPWVIKRIVDSSFGQFMLLSFLFAKPVERSEGGTNFDVRIGRELRADDEEEEDNADDEEAEYAEVSEMPSNRGSVESVPKMRKNIQQDWISLATLIDRIAFVLYSLVFILLAIVYQV